MKSKTCSAGGLVFLLSVATGVAAQTRSDFSGVWTPVNTAPPPGGGYVFNTIHNIQADVPPANVVAMWDALRGYDA